MANEIILRGSEYVHLPERSSYNHNYYQHIETGEIILEDCDEYYNSWTFYRVENNENVCLGVAEDDLTNNETVTIHPDWA